MRFLNLILIIFLSLTISIKAESNQNIIDELERGGKLIFIRHAYAPGNGDPENFNLNEDRISQAKNIGKLFKKNKIKIFKVFSSEWCRCKETAEIAFNDFSTKNFLNSFYSPEFQKNKSKQVKELSDYIQNFDSKKNLILITHYVLIYEILGYAPSSGEIVISDKNFNKIGSLEINF